MSKHLDHILKVTQVASEVVLGKDLEIRQALTCILAGGHLLIEDAPGVGKTTLVKTLSKLLGLESHRIQFTVDLLPSDILGSPIFDPRDQKFHFHPGPLFAPLILADELNRASPRTQSALLQAMEEGEVSIDGVLYPLPQPFLVIATQNPHQQMGTFPLPESQLDRFLMSLELNYADSKTEIRIFSEVDPQQKLKDLKPMLNAGNLLEIQNEVRKVKVGEKVATYVSGLLTGSRSSKAQWQPLSTRAGLALIRAAQAHAYLEDRAFTRPDDVQAVLIPVLGHRLGGFHGIRQGRGFASSLQASTVVPI
ncbi:MAG: AAA family ATPase [Pseudobdellovibrionaceae bacterium]